jgi:putative sterol carrier protein
MHLVVQQVVTGGPDGDVAYHVIVDDGRTTVRAGRADDPTVTFTQDRDTARAVSRGELSAQGAFMAGRIRVRGDLPALVAQQDALLRVDDVFASVRETTEY